jgi:hypothetical protein
MILDVLDRGLFPTALRRTAVMLPRGYRVKVVCGRRASLVDDSCAAGSFGSNRHWLYLNRHESIGAQKMNDPMITCPNCQTDIKLTESLAALLIQSTREHFEKRIAQTDADVAVRETAMRR